MGSWNEGYVTDVNYTHGYYPELNPLRARFLLTNAGIATSEPSTACELGFGQGVSIVAHGAAQPSVEWWGTDFNPAHAAFAQALSGSPERAARLPDESFEQFCGRADLPEFDFIGLHGIWTWISHENHRLVVDFIRRKLKVGGVLYISYNTFPGWSDLAPLRHLVKRHVEVMGAPGADLFDRIGSSLDFAGKVLGTDPFYSKASPRSLESLKSLQIQNRNYIAHEYLTSDWHTMYFAELAKWLQPAKLSFGTSATPLDHVDALNLKPEQKEILAGIRDREFRESVRDFFIHQQFRRDYWVKGLRILSPPEKLQQQRKLGVILVQPRNQVPMKIRGVLGEAELQPAIYNPILDFLGDHSVRSFGEIEEAVRSAGVAVGQVESALTILVGCGAVMPAIEVTRAKQAKTSTDALNQEIIARALHAPDVGYLVSPVVAGAVPISRFDQLFLGSTKAGLKSAPEFAQTLWSGLQSVGQAVVKEGRTLTTSEENLAELTARAEEFLARLPIYKALMLI